MNKFKLFVVLASVFAVSMIGMEDVFAKGSSSSSSSRSSSSSSSRSSSSSGSKSWGSSTPKSTPAPSKSWGSSTPKSTPAPSKSWGSSTPQSQPKPSSSNLSGTKSSVPKTAADKAKQQKYESDLKQYQSAKASGKVFDTKDAAVAAWKSENANKYSSKFSSEPAKRPEYIPTSTKLSDGKSVNITYNVNSGGYGYTNALGQFILWDAMTDIAFMNANMSSYYVGPPPAQPIYVDNSGNRGFASMFSILLLVFVCVAIFGFAIFK